MMSKASVLVLVAIVCLTRGTPHTEVNAKTPNAPSGTTGPDQDFGIQAGAHHQDSHPPCPGKSGLADVSRADALTFYAKSQNGTGKMECTNCGSGKVPEGVMCVRKNAVVASKPEWACIGNFSGSVGYEIHSTTVECGRSSGFEPCSESGACRLIFSVRKTEAAGNLTLMVFVVIIILTLFWIQMKRSARKNRALLSFRVLKLNDLSKKPESHVRRNTVVFPKEEVPDVRLPIALSSSTIYYSSMSSYNSIDSNPPPRELQSL